MHTAQRAIRRFALIAWLGLMALTGLPALSTQAATPPERALPDSTIFFLKVADLKAFRDAFSKSQYGQLWNDSAMDKFREELSQKLEDTSRSVREKIGVSLRELVDLPQGVLAIAAVPNDDPNLPVSIVLIADMGENQKKTLEVLERTGKQAEEAGAKLSTESFNGLTLHIAQTPKEKGDKDDKEKDKDKDKDTPNPPVVWTNSGSLFLIGSDIAAIKDVAANRDGRENSLAASEAFAKTQAKIDSGHSQVVWYLDMPKLVKLVLKANTKADQQQAQQAEVLAQELGIFGLKSIGGCFTLGNGSYDSLNKIFFNAPKPVQGLLKIFSFPPVALRPESWVPATVATYQTLSVDLDGAFTAINDLVNKFQPGMINLVEQQLVGPNGGQPISFQQDVFGPLGNRITLISDFKKPIKEDSQRMLFGVALDNAKAFKDTIGRLMTATQAAPQQREFQGTTIYDFTVDLPAQPAGNAAPGIRSISMAVAKDTLFLTTDTTLLEQVLRPGNAPLADSSGYQSIAKEFPEKISGFTYVRPDESARLSYDMIKSGQFAKVFQQMAAQGAQGRGGRDVPDLSKVIPGEKLPDFSVFAKYLSLGGGSSVMDDDGFTMTGFTLRRSANP
jgi:hypothetical protein